MEYIKRVTIREWGDEVFKASREYLCNVCTNECYDGSYEGVCPFKKKRDCLLFDIWFDSKRDAEASEYLVLIIPIKPAPRYSEDPAYLLESNHISKSKQSLIFF